MQRGIVIVNKLEFQEVYSKIDLSRFNGTALIDKLNLTYKYFVDNPVESQAEIQLSEEEIEMILDEIAIFVIDGSEYLKKGIKVFNEALLRIRNYGRNSNSV